MRKCGSCGAGASDSALKCPECRAWLVSTAPPGVSPPTQVGVAAGSWAPVPPPPPTGPPVFVAPPLPEGPTFRSARRGSGKVWIKRGVFFLVAFLVYAAVHGYRESNNPYSHASQESFVSGCEGSGVNEDMCRCMFGWIKSECPCRGLQGVRAPRHVARLYGRADARLGGPGDRARAARCRNGRLAAARYAPG